MDFSLYEKPAIIEPSYPPSHYHGAIPIVLIGLGGIGGRAAEGAYRTLAEEYGNTLCAYALDADPNALAHLQISTVLCRAAAPLTEVIETLSPDEKAAALGNCDVENTPAYHLHSTENEIYSRTNAYLVFKAASRSVAFRKFEKELLAFIKKNRGALIYFVTTSTGDFGSAVLQPLAAHLASLCREANASVRFNAVVSAPTLALNEHDPLSEGRSAANAYALIKEILALHIPTLPLHKAIPSLLGLPDESNSRSLFSSVTIVDQMSCRYAFNLCQTLLADTVVAQVLSKRFYHTPAIGHATAYSLRLPKRKLADRIVSHKIGEFCRLPFYRVLKERAEENATLDDTLYSLLQEISDGKAEDTTEGFFDARASKTLFPDSLSLLLERWEERFVKTPSENDLLPDFSWAKQTIDEITPKRLISRAERKHLHQTLLALCENVVQKTRDFKEALEYRRHYPLGDAIKYLDELFDSEYHEELTLLHIADEKGGYRHPILAFITLSLLRRKINTRLAAIDDAQFSLEVSDTLATVENTPLSHATNKSAYYRLGRLRLIEIAYSTPKSCKHPFDDLAVLRADLDELENKLISLLHTQKKRKLYQHLLERLTVILEDYQSIFENAVNTEEPYERTDENPHTALLDTERLFPDNRFDENTEKRLKALTDDGVGRDCYQEITKHLSETRYAHYPFRCDVSFIKHRIRQVFDETACKEKLEGLSLLESLGENDAQALLERVKAHLKDLPRFLASPYYVLIPQNELAILQKCLDELMPPTYDLYGYAEPRPDPAEFFLKQLSITPRRIILTRSATLGEGIILYGQEDFVSPETYTPLPLPYRRANVHSMRYALEAYRSLQKSYRDGKHHANPHIFAAFHEIALPFEE